MYKTEWRKKIDKLEVGETVKVTSTMKEYIFRSYIYGQLAQQTGRRYSINKIKDNQYNITRRV
jgi:hypothetical protein